MPQDDVAKKMDEASDQPPVPGKSGSGGPDSSAENAGAMTEKMSEAGSNQGAAATKPSPGFEDPLPPDTDSKSGPGSDGPL